jgi:hypothetical protein
LFSNLVGLALIGMWALLPHLRMPLSAGRGWEQPTIGSTREKSQAQTKASATPVPHVGPFAMVLNDRLLIHLRDERKQDLLFLLNMRIHLDVKFLNQLSDLCKYRRPITAFRRHLRSQLDESRKLLTNAAVMNADDG